MLGFFALLRMTVVLVTLKCHAEHREASKTNPDKKRFFAALRMTTTTIGYWSLYIDNC